MNNDCLKFTRFVAGTAFGAYILIDEVGRLLFTGNSLDRALADAESATVAFFRINLVMKKLFADTCSALFFADMFFIFRPEIL